MTVDSNGPDRAGPSKYLGVCSEVRYEPFTSREGISFALIWSAIAIYLASHLRARANQARGRPL